MPRPLQRAVLLGSGVVALLLIGAGAAYLSQSGDFGGHVGLAANPPAPVAATPSAPQAAARAAAAPAAIAPSFDVVKIGPDGDAVIAGHAAPGAKVTVMDAGRPIGAVTADNGGDWVLLPQAPVAPGQSRLTLEATDPNTGAKSASSATVVLNRPARDTASGAASGGADTTTALAVLVPHDPAQAVRTLQVPAASAAPTAAAPALPELGSVDYDASGRVMLAGHAPPGATLRLYAGAAPLATVTADKNGNWSVTPERALPPGRYQLRLDEIGRNGAVVARVTQPFERAAPAALKPGQNYVVQPGNNLWLIARRTYGAGIRYTVIYSANSGKIHSPALIYPGQIFTLPKS